MKARGDVCTPAAKTNSSSKEELLSSELSSADGRIDFEAIVDELDSMSSALIYCGNLEGFFHLVGALSTAIRLMGESS